MAVCCPAASLSSDCVSVFPKLGCLWPIQQGPYCIFREKTFTFCWLLESYIPSFVSYTTTFARNLLHHPHGPKLGIHTNLKGISFPFFHFFLCRFKKARSSRITCFTSKTYGKFRVCVYVHLMEQKAIKWAFWNTPFGTLDSYYICVCAPCRMPPSGFSVISISLSNPIIMMASWLFFYFCIFLSISNQRLLEIDIHRATCPTLQLIGRTSYCYIEVQESASCFDREDNAYISASLKLKGHLNCNS